MPAPARQSVLGDAQLVQQRVNADGEMTLGARDAFASPRLLPPPEGRRTRWLPPGASGGSADRETLVGSGRRKPPLHILMFGPLLAGPEAVKFRELDSFLPSRVQMGPVTLQHAATGRTTVTTTLDAGPTWISHRRLLPWVNRRALVTVPLVILKASSLRAGS